MVRLARAPWQVIDRIAPKVTVYAHGACVGAGAEITAYAGRVVAAPDAFFALPEVRMGLVPGAGGSVSVPRRIGRWRAAWLMLTGDRLPAAAALRWGLADDISGPAGPVPGSLPGRCLREGPEHGDQRAGVLGGASPVSRPDAACGTVRNSVPSCWYRIPIGAVP
jgi:enoyl-CoA hydratase/carnithine racemase